MVFNVHRNQKAYQGRGEGEGEGVWRWGKREIIYLSLHCHHKNDSCMKMGSDESHSNVSVGGEGGVSYRSSRQNRTALEKRIHVYDNT